MEEEEEAEEDCDDGATFCGGALGEGVRDDGTAVAAVLLPFAVPVVSDVSAVPASSTGAGLGAAGLSAGQGGAAELPVELPVELPA